MEDFSVKKNLFSRAAAITAAAVLTFGAGAMFTGCTTNKPEVKITYTFNEVDYEVDYILSRKSAPATVQHFIELADHGYYDGLCVHDYSSAFLYTGGYTYENGTIVEKNYFETVKDYNLTQSVFNSSEDDRVGLNTVYGEFTKNGMSVTGSRYYHEAGALVMYYTDKGDDNTRVTTIRNSDGSLQNNCEYKYNSATSLFYTFTGSSNSSRDAQYCVFGMAKDYANQMKGDNGLLTAIQDYIDDLAEEEDFTESVSIANVNQYDQFESVRNEKIGATGDNAYKVPKSPIIIKSVKVTKY